MNIELINDLRPIKLKHAKEILSLLINKRYEFDILCVTKYIEFNPALPEHISSNFGEMILFSLANYTLESAKIIENDLVFEAGFGEENFGSIVTVPIKSILQITHNESPLFVNITATFDEPKPTNPFELNPRNKKFMT